MSASRLTVTELVQLSEAQKALAEVETPADAKELYDRLEALTQYARRYGIEHGQMNEIAEAKLRTARKGGQLLESFVARGYKSETRIPEGISRSRSSRWQLLAAISDAEFEAHLASVKAGEDELTLAGTLRLARLSGQHESVPPPPLPAGVWEVLYADPPWRYEDATPNRAVENHYPTMTVEELCALAVPSAEDAVLFMWATAPKLVEALAIFDAWGFEYRTNAVWVKDKIGMGYYVRGRHELLLIGRRGTPGVPAPANRRDSVIEAPRGRHSAKPDAAYELIEVAYPSARRLELFARSERDGWDSWGHQAEAA